MMNILADAVNQMGSISGSIQGALGCLGAALGVALVGMKSVDAVGRNPGAFGHSRNGSGGSRCVLRALPRQIKGTSEYVRNISVGRESARFSVAVRG